MTYHATVRRGARHDRSGAAVHTWSIGQMVRLSDGLGRPVPPGALYRITGTLPANGGAPQYRIRNNDERYERVAAQDSLQLADTPVNSAETLMERTFGYG